MSLYEKIKTALEQAIAYEKGEVSLSRMCVIDESKNVIAATDFTDEQKNLEVWKALGLQEEDFYKE